MQRLSTGVPVMDRQLGGGVPAGSLVSLSTPPDTQSELLVEKFTEPRRTRYLSTMRPAAEIRDQFDGDDLHVEQVDPKALLDSPSDHLADLPDRSTVVVDPVNPLETSRSQYTEFLSTLKRRLRETDSVALFHCIEADETSFRWLTLARADMTWRLQLVVGAITIETRLVITKDRGGNPLLEPLKVHLTDEVAVDTSRDIA